MSLKAQDVTTVEASSDDVSENLDLEAVASLFGEAKDLEDFEKRLNDPKTQISNLDLNEDGEVDYIRVIEAAKDDTHVVTLQVVLGDDQFQDVATIDVEKDDQGETHVQVVGDVYMYGDNYIIEPVYVHPPVVVVWFWGPLYHPWRSPYYWGYYPPYYHPWRPYPTHRYKTNVNVHINVNNSYRHTTVRRSKTSIELQNNSRRNDFGKKNPDQSFARRNDGVKNKQGLSANKAPNRQSDKRTGEVRKSTGREVQEDWKPKTERSGQKSQVKDNKVSVPADKSAVKPKSKSQNVGNVKSGNVSKPKVNNSAKPKSKPKAPPKKTR